MRCKPVTDIELVDDEEASRDSAYIDDGQRKVIADPTIFHVLDDGHVKNIRVGPIVRPTDVRGHFIIGKDALVLRAKDDVRAR
ncbi:hypothetical protein SPKIRA_37340 (plasmid) [Sphingomonas paucimobilis]|nr:hypothetical protein SPKIRA_37340 [Sphingomonas paucimobilis]